LGDAGAGDLVHRLAGGIRHKMDMQGRVIHLVKLGCRIRTVTGFHNMSWHKALTHQITSRYKLKLSMTISP
jgi:S-ribosylhomocysteine lyase LuxS involved in autoinducer biosynthesis